MFLAIVEQWLQRKHDLPEVKSSLVKRRNRRKIPRLAETRMFLDTINK